MRILPVSLNNNVAFKSKLPPVIEHKDSTVQDYWGKFAETCLKDYTNRENLDFCLRTISNNGDNGILTLDVIKRTRKPDEYCFSLYNKVDDIVSDKKDSNNAPNLKRSLGTVRIYKDNTIHKYVASTDDDKQSENKLSGLYSILNNDLTESLLNALRRITCNGTPEHNAIYSKSEKYKNPKQYLDTYRQNYL